MATPRAVLIVDDDREMRALLKDVLEDRGYHVAVAQEGREALDRLEQGGYLVVLTDLRMPGMNGADLLHEILRRRLSCNVIMMTAFGTVASAVDAMKRGAFDYLTKPIKTDELLVTVDKALREASLRQEVAQLRKQISREYAFDQIFGKSKPMRAVFDLIRRVADAQANVLITGESGTGKELVAKAIHFNGRRKDAPFIPVNCAAIPDQLLESELFGHVKGAFTDARSEKPGLFEEAQTGTIFLDEIGEMPMMLQPKLLRAVQEREIRRVGATRSTSVNVRIIASTNLSLTEEVKAKRFREDLYYRLNVIEIWLPPLRERKEDVPLLCDALLRKVAASRDKPMKGITESALGLLLDYDWPGNVRELENVMERAVTLAPGEMVTVEVLPRAIREVNGERQVIQESVERLLSMDEVDRVYINRILEKSRGNKSKTAQILGIDRKTLYRKLAEMQQFGS